MSSNAAPALLQGQRVLVTGAGGQLGRYLAPAVRSAGATLITAGSRPGPGIDYAVDLSDREAVLRLFAAATPNAVLHGAACTDVDGIEREPRRGELGNAVATRNIALAARQAGAYLVAVSTDMVFSGEGGAPYVEDAPPGPVSAYGASKLLAEEAVLTGNADFAVARTAWLYGGAGKHFPRTVLGVLRTRGSIDVVDDERGSPTFAGDLAKALVSLAAARGSGVFHLINAGAASRFEFARETARLAGFDAEAVRPISTATFLERFPLPARRPPDSTLQNIRAADLGIALREWREALADYIPALADDLQLPAALDRG